MHWIYVIEANDRSWYIGETTDLKKRISDHQSGNCCRTTAMKNDWFLIYCEGYILKQDALGRERFLKSGSGRRYLKKQLTHYLQNNIGNHEPQIAKEGKLKIVGKEGSSRYEII